MQPSKAMHVNLLQPSNAVSVYLPAFLKSSLSVVSSGIISRWFFSNSLACFTCTTACMTSQIFEQQMLCTPPSADGNLTTLACKNYQTVQSCCNGAASDCFTIQAGSHLGVDHLRQLFPRRRHKYLNVTSIWMYLHALSITATILRVL